MTAMIKAAATAPESLREIEAVFDRLWPLLRSLTGAGVRATHDILGEIVPLERIEVASGTPVFDWTVPNEWVVREAYVRAPDGRRILDVAENNLRLVNYAAPFRGTVSRRELDAHLHSRPDLPDAIPYVTSYYEPRWGFCLSENERKALPEGDYDVVVDTALVDGALTISEAVLPGASQDEVLISSYTCHPSLANNELSGPLAAAFLYCRLAAWPQRRFTYRFVFAPETIGAISYLSLRGAHLRERLAAGYVVNCVGLDSHFTYKRSRRGDSLADRAALEALAHFGIEFRVRDFAPTGSDERQYCSPGFNLPVGSLMRGVHGEYPEYHTSLDNKSLISFRALQESIAAYEAVCRALESKDVHAARAVRPTVRRPLDRNATFENLFPYGEPQLGRRGLYPTLGSADQSRRVAALMWVLNFSDGRHDLPAIAERSGLPIAQLADAAIAAESKGVLKRCAPA
jgi:aminopeptidase-like protein